LAELIESAEAVAAHVLRQPEIAGAGIVAAYVSVGTEPGTGPLLEALRERGVRVLLPVVQPELDLDWAPYAGAELLVSARLGMLAPTTAPLGPDAVASADVVLCPGLAVDGRGNRLGRGGGSYDRALRRLRFDSPRWVLVYDDERLARVPVDAHDVQVSGVVTPTGVHHLPVLQATPPPTEAPEAG
jgi:5-formyltetrahydrofolate cyclo-ligase